MKRVVLGVWLALATLVSVARAEEPRAQFRLDGGQPHVGMPFTLQLLVEGFDESPAPATPKLEIPNATVTPLGATPNVSRSIQIVNGRRSDSVRVTWALQWRVEVNQAGTMRVPATTVTQGAKKATAQSGEVTVQTVPLADDMKITLDLPARPVFVGETVPLTLTWLFRRDPQDQTFSVPMLSSDAFTVSAPAIQSQQGRTRALTLSAGSKDLQLAYTVDKTTVGGVEFNRLQATFYAAPRKVGKIEIAAASVVAALPVGRADFFGNAPTRLFRASDTARTLEVKALPETDRPATFAGAVGDQFSISVDTSRSVVSLGEPMQLDVTIKSNQPLDTLALGKLDGEGRLPKDTFTVPGDPPTGELSDEGKTKTFKVTAQVTGPATEVPALAFSYFDPAKSQYVTITSEPIALSVKGTNVVGAGDVVAIAPTKPPRGTPQPGVTIDGTIDSSIDAQLALSSLGAVHTQPLGGTFLWILVGLLYALPLAMLAVRTWQLRTRDVREDAAELRAARRKVEQLLDDAATKPAREIAGPLGAALRDLARAAGHTDLDGAVLAKLETETFAPSAASNPLSPDLRSDAAGLLRRWVKPVAMLLVLAGGLAYAPPAYATPLDEGRTAYQQAMELANDASARKAAFARAASALGEAARTYPDRPELLADWGNAALGAGDVATATLAYRRALVIDGSNARARANLALLRSRQGDMYRPTSSSATDTLLFFHEWPTPRKHIVGAAAFAIAILLLVPWRGARRRNMVGLSVLPLVVWIAMIASVLVADDHADDAVIMDDVVLRAADSAGAPAALPSPLPRGVEVSIREQRDSWARVELANGTIGWIPSGAVERVLR
ncbi:MAG: BatD family protein [Kofleriaceae bacterium]